MTAAGAGLPEARQGRLDAAARRGLDLLAAVVGLPLVAPVIAAAAVALKLDSPGPALYRARRVGRGGREFTMLKLRSMRAGAAGPGLTVRQDSRVTPVGAWLRRHRIDELPQLVNVLAGQMSLVGPRPEDPSVVARYTGEQRMVLTVRPGLTSPATLAFRGEADELWGSDPEGLYLEKVVPRKVAMELEYLARRTVWSDLGVLWRTVLAVCGTDRRRRTPLAG